MKTMSKLIRVKTINAAVLTLTLLVGGLIASPAPVVFAKVMPHSVPTEPGLNAQTGTDTDGSYDEQNQIAGMPYLIIQQYNNPDSRISRLSK
jgi:hypothetical protein